MKSPKKSSWFRFDIRSKKTPIALLSVTLLAAPANECEPKPPGDGTFPPVADYAATGPFRTVREAGGLFCTIYRPAVLGEFGRKHPVIIWGNGTLAFPDIYGFALTHWASHGFIVAAANTPSAGTGREMLACLDYVIAENSRFGSPFFNTVNTSRVGASGHSQGGGGTLMAGRDQRITATAPLQPYTVQGFGGFDQSSILRQHAPMFLMSGSADTIAPASPNQTIVYAGANVPIFWGMLRGADHLIAGTGNLGGYRGPSTAWFRYHLMNDENARGFFYGANCRLCTDPFWIEQRKGIQ